jgi:epoxide hydrolase-like predicted phosphatase
VYEAIIFDFFNVIHSDPFLRWLKRYGYKRTGEFEESSRLVDVGHISEREFYEKLSALSGQTLESVRAIFSDTSLIDRDMVELIKGLHNNYKTGLLSNSSGEYLRPILEQHNLTRLFDEVVISSEVGLLKPDAEIFKHILHKLRVKPENAIFIDDNARYVDAASAIGIQAIVYTDTESVKRQLAGLGVVTTI